MEEIKNLITSPAFWLASVVIAFLMSFFAAYAKEYADKLLQLRTKINDMAAQKRQEDFERKVEKIKANSLALSLYQSNIIYQKIRQVLYYVVSYMCLALSAYSLANLNLQAGVIMLACGLLITLTAVRSVNKILYELRSVVNAALDDDDTHFIG
jgi:enoyl-[acyl-carrier-protein] reductase (NADH)